MTKWKIRIRGPLAADLPAVCAALEARGYTRLSIRNLARRLAPVSRWLADHQLGAGDLTRETIDRFVRARRATRTRIAAAPPGSVPLGPSPPSVRHPRARPSLFEPWSGERRTARRESPRGQVQ